MGSLTGSVLCEGHEQIASSLLTQDLFDALPVAVDVFHHLQGHIKGAPSLLARHWRSGAVFDMFDEVA
jgi:hypothetical protein